MAQDEMAVKQRGKPLMPSLSSRELVYMEPILAEQRDGGKESPSATLLRHDKKKRRNWLLACAMMLILVTLITISSQLSNLAFTDPNLKFHAPFLFLMIKMSFRVLTFPVFLLISSLTRKLYRGHPVDIKENCRHCAEVFGPGGWTWRNFILKFAPSAITVLITQVGWILGLAHLSASLATAIICSAVAFSYVFTSCFLGQPVLLVKSFFVAVAFGGICLIVYANFMPAHTAEAFTSQLTGIIAVITASVFDALHLLSFKKAFPELDIGQTSFVVSTMFLLNCLVLWPVPLALALSHREQFNSSNMPYGILFGAWISSALSSIAAGYGLILSNPFFMSISELLILALNSVIDVLFRNVVMHSARIAGSVLIAISFVVLILPDEYVSIHIRFRAKKAEEAARASERKTESVPLERKLVGVKATTSAMNVPGLDRMAAAE